MTIHVRSF